MTTKDGLPSNTVPFAYQDHDGNTWTGYDRGGRIAEFRGPDGHELSLWQIPREGAPEYEHVEPLARHFARLRAAVGR